MAEIFAKYTRKIPLFRMFLLLFAMINITNKTRNILLLRIADVLGRKQRMSLSLEWLKSIQSLQQS